MYCITFSAESRNEHKVSLQGKLGVLRAGPYVALQIMKAGKEHKCAMNKCNRTSFRPQYFLFGVTN